LSAVIIAGKECQGIDGKSQMLLENVATDKSITSCLALVSQYISTNTCNY
jgi:hypothetical protein